MNLSDLFHLTHKHSGGDGALIDHADLLGLTDDDHTQYVKHALATAAYDFLVASGSGAFVKKTLSEVISLLGGGFYCNVYNSANISIPNNSWTVLTFDSEQSDVSNMHSQVSNTNRITLPVAGFYLYGACVGFASNATGVRYSAIQVNGSTILRNYGPNLGASYNVYQTLSSGYYFAANDYLTLLVYQNSGGALNSVATAGSAPVLWAAKII